MHSDVAKSSADVEDADIAASLCIIHEIGEAEERVEQDKHGHLIERFNVIRKAWFKRFEPLQKEAHDQWGVAQYGKLTQHKVSHKDYC